MGKRITLIHLIDYIDDYVKSQGLIENNYDIEECKTVLEKVPFNILKYGSNESLSNIPNNLLIKKVFDPFIDNIYRFGSIHEDNNQNKNISLLFSILYCVKKDFHKTGHDKQKQLVNDLKNKILKDITSENLFQEYNLADLGWLKKELKSSIENHKNNRMSLRFLANYFNINIFLLNIQEDKIYSIYPEELFNIFKMNVFLVYNDDVFEPLGYKNELLWDYNFDPFKKLVNVDKELVSTLNVNFTPESDEKIFQIGTEDLDKYLDKDNDNKENEEDEEDDGDNNFEEIEIVDTDAVVEENDIETEENINNNNSNSIFYKKEESSSDEVLSSSDESISNTEVDITDIEGLSTKSKLAEIQEVAKNHNVSLANGETKNGKVKLKTKKQLMDDLDAILKANQ